MSTIDSTAGMQRSEELGPLDDIGLCLLSLDGGGVRGLSSLYILKGIMARLNHERGLDNLPPVKPCDVFDLIGGTSTGGLIAIMLGRLEMDVDECITVYTEFMKSVFEQKSIRFPISLTGKSKSRFKSAKLENAIKKAIVEHGYQETDLFNDGVDRRCRVFVCTIAHETKEIVRLRSYNLPGKLNIPATISEAALATSAATTFFDPVDIGARTFADGALGANNPVEEVEGEASNIWCPDTADLKPLVKCFISVGTGDPGKKPMNLGIVKFLSQTLVEIATETDNTEKKFIAKWRQHFDEKRYFRFSVNQGLQHIKLTEYQEQGAIEAATDGYLDHQEQGFRVRDCVQNLKLKRNASASNLSRVIATRATHFHSTPMLRSIETDMRDLKYKWDLWLRPSNMRAIHDSKIREKLSGTCDWIWSHHTFLDWSSTSMDIPAVGRRLLCIYGTHGCGKSVLASSLLESLKHKGDQVFYFSFSGADINRQGLDNLARSFLWQLLQEPSDRSIDAMKDLMSRGQPLTSELWSTFKHIMTSMPGFVYWVIDGVDECKESGEELMNQVADLLNLVKGARAVLLGRTHILQPISQTNYTIEVASNLIQPDIDAFINTEINKSTILRSPEIRDLAFKALCNGSQGMFLWVKLMVRDLHISSSKAEVIQRLHNLPRGLQEAYRHLLSQLVDNLDDIDLKFARRLLGFVIVARRPLKVQELQYAEALAFRSNLKTSYECSLEDCIPEDIVGKVLRICGCFIRITDGVVLLVHISAKEFLTRPEFEWSRDGDRKIIPLRINPEESHYLFVSTCIDYLNFGGYGLPLQDEDEPSTLYSIHPFLEYASKNLIHHINRAEIFSDEIFERFRQYLESEASLCWIEFVAIYLMEDGSSGLEAQEFMKLFSAGTGEGLFHCISSRLNLQLEYLKKSFGENDRRTDLYRLILDMVEYISDDESIHEVSDCHDSFAMRNDPNDTFRRTVPMMTEILRQNNVLTRSKQLILCLRLVYHIKRATALTNPLELLFGLVLRNTCNVPIYALTIVADFYRRMHQPEKALQVYHSAMTRFGDRDVPMKYEIWRQIASINYSLRRYQEAEEPYQRVIEGARIFGLHYTVALTSMHELGMAFFIQGKNVQAQETFQRLVKRKKEILGLEHRDTLHSIYTLGNILHVQGKYTEAEDAFQQAIKGQERILGPEHEDTFSSIHSLGCTLGRQRKYTEAEETYRQLLKRREKVLGPEHENTLQTINNLGTALLDQGKHEEAEEEFQRAIKGWEKILSPEHENTLQSTINLGCAVGHQGKHAEAEKLFRQVLKRREILSPEHILTLNAIDNLVWSLSNQGKYAEMEEVLEQAIKGKEKNPFDPGNERILWSIHQLAETFVKHEKYLVAEKVYQQIIKGSEKAFGLEHRTTLISVYSLGDTFYRHKKYTKAEEAYRRAIKAEEKEGIGLEHAVAFLAKLHRLGSIFRRQRKYVQAKEMYQRAAEGRNAILGPGHGDTLFSTRWLTKVLRHLAKYVQIGERIRALFDEGA